jgi:hypothetical protein
MTRLKLETYTDRPGIEPMELRQNVLSIPVEQ